VATCPLCESELPSTEAAQPHKRSIDDAGQVFHRPSASSIISIFTLVGFVVYLILRAGQEGFYDALNISTSDIGLSEPEILGHAVVQGTLILYFFITGVLIGHFLGWLGFRRSKMKLSWRIVVLVLVAFGPPFVLLLTYQATPGSSGRATVF